MRQNKEYHFIGIGGIGMSALARILLLKGKKVSGSDLKSTKIVRELQKKGACISIGQKNPSFSKDTLVIYSSAIGKDNEDLKLAKKLQCCVMHRSDLLTQLMSKDRSLLVAGTHGKTTTSGLLAYVLSSSLDPSFAVGGTLLNFSANAHFGKGEYFVAEADESDGSFLSHPCFAAIVTNVEWDHVDYWKTKSSLERAFRKFLAKPAKWLFWCAEDPGLNQLSPKGISYGFIEKADLQGANFQQKEDCISFDVFFEGKTYKKVQIPMLGKYNALNALAVFGFALKLGIDPEEVRTSFLTFKGIARRNERIYDRHSIAIYNDYAHHPTEIEVTLSALRQKILEKRLIVVYQPHRPSRIQAFFQAFQKCFVEADLLVVTDIYAASESIPKEISGEIIAEKVSHKNCLYIPKKDLLKKLPKMINPHDVIVFLSAGDLPSIVGNLGEIYATNYKKLKIGVIFGGEPLEHEVSCASAQYVLKNLNPDLYEPIPFFISKKGYWQLEGSQSSQKLPKETLEKLMQCDICFPVLHGPKGEDGTMQGFLETLSLPYVGCGVESSAISMNKAWAKALAIQHQIPTPPFLEITKAKYMGDPNAFLESVRKTDLFPLYVKGCHLGSSMGIEYVENKSNLLQAIEKNFLVDDHIILEKEIVGTQIEFALLGNRFIHVGVPAEITHKKFYSYENKYAENHVLVPARISEDLAKLGKQYAKKLYESMQCSGFARIDFFLDEENKLWFNEINPIPGLTPASAYQPMLRSRMSDQQIIDQLLILAMHKKRMAYHV